MVKVYISMVKVYISMVKVYIANNNFSCKGFCLHKCYSISQSHSKLKVTCTGPWNGNHYSLDLIHVLMHLHH